MAYSEEQRKRLFILWCLIFLFLNSSSLKSSNPVLIVDQVGIQKLFTFSIHLHLLMPLWEFPFILCSVSFGWSGSSVYAAAEEMRGVWFSWPWAVV